MNVRKLGTTAVLVTAGLALTACGHGTDSAQTQADWAAKHSAKPSPSKYDKGALQREAWKTQAADYPAAVKLGICTAAKKGGKAGVVKEMSGNEFPFEPAVSKSYDAAQWVAYCAKH